MSDAYDRAYDPARVPQIEKQLSNRVALSGVNPDSTMHRDISYLHGFKGKANNGVRTRPQEPPAGSPTWRWIQSPAEYNEMSTALTNRAASGQAAKDSAAFNEMRNTANRAPGQFQQKKETIKINTDPAKGK